MKQKFMAMPLSKLAFIITTSNYSTDDKNKAYEEVKKRFAHNGCSYKAFMENEEYVVEKRGEDLNNYLIGQNPDSQLFMKLFLEKTIDYFYESDGLMFSEKLLCNSNTKNSFCTRALEMEQKNLLRRLDGFKADTLEKKELEEVYKVIEQRLLKKNIKWSDNSYTDCVYDIISGFTSFFDDDEIDAKNETELKRLEKFKLRLFMLLSFNESLEALNQYYIIGKEFVRLSHQRRMILKSFISGSEVDYSNIDRSVAQKVMKKQIIK